MGGTTASHREGLQHQRCRESAEEREDRRAKRMVDISSSSTPFLTSYLQNFEASGFSATKATTTQLFGGSSGAPPPSYSAPPSSQGLPPSSYGASPPSAYSATPSTYGAPPSIKSAPTSTYGAPPSTYIAQSSHKTSSTAFGTQSSGIAPKGLASTPMGLMQQSQPSCSDMWKGNEFGLNPLEQLQQQRTLGQYSATQHSAATPSQFGATAQPRLNSAAQPRLNCQSQHPQTASAYSSTQPDQFYIPPQFSSTSSWKPPEPTGFNMKKTSDYTAGSARSLSSTDYTAGSARSLSSTDCTAGSARGLASTPMELMVKAAGGASSQLWQGNEFGLNKGVAANSQKSTSQQGHNSQQPVRYHNRIRPATAYGTPSRARSYGNQARQTTTYGTPSRATTFGNQAGQATAYDTPSRSTTYGNQAGQATAYGTPSRLSTSYGSPSRSWDTR